MLRKLIILDTPHAYNSGLKPEQRMQSRQHFERSESADIEHMIQQGYQMFPPPQLSTPSVNAAVQEHGNGMSDATTTAPVATPFTGPTKRNTVGLDTFTQHYRIQNQITKHTGWRQSVMPEERGQLALQFFEQYRLSGPEQAEDGATRVSLDRGVSLNLETETFMAAKDKESYVSIMKQQSMAMTPARQEQLWRCYDNELATDRNEYDDPGAPRPTNSTPRSNDRSFDNPSAVFTDTVTEVDPYDTLSTDGNVGDTSPIKRVLMCPEPRCGENFKGSSDLKYVYSIIGWTMSLMHFQKTSAKAPEAVQVRPTILQTW
jgi:hypothetical protein